MSGKARITPYRDGPLVVRGPFVLCDQDGNEIAVRNRTIALCRCGRSRRKPFCDGMHKAVGWRAESGAQDPEPRFLPRTPDDERRARERRGTTGRS